MREEVAELHIHRILEPASLVKTAGMGRTLEYHATTDVHTHLSLEQRDRLTSHGILITDIIPRYYSLTLVLQILK